MRLTEEQERVVLADVPAFTVRAAAGSGKTSVLVLRYLEHVVTQGLRPDQVYAVTFTRKAAAEMKRRVVSRLRADGRAEDARLAETGPIQTIHGLCERLLRENALEAGVDPEFTVLEGPLRTTVQEEAVRHAIRVAPDESPEAAALLQLLGGKRSFRGPGGLHAALRQHVTGLLDALRSSGLTRERLEADYATPEVTVATWAAAMAEDVPALIAEVAGAFDGGWLDRATAAKGTTKAPAWLRPTIAEDLEATARDTCGLMRYVLEAWAALDSEMEARQAFDFALLEAKTVRALEGNPTVRERVRRQVRAVLVDEAQDVNPVQYRLLDALGADRVMMVGDPQQSIYGFRMTDRRLFIDRSERQECFDLSVNHRSRPGVLAFVDKVFQQEWGEGYRPMLAPVASTGDDPFAVVSPPMLGVELWPMEAKATPALAERVAEVVEELGDANRVAVLMRGNRELSEIARHLSLRRIDSRRTGGGERFYARMEVRDVANALQALCDPYDDYTLLCLLRSPFVGLSMDGVVQLADRRPVFDALAEYGQGSDPDRVRVARFLAWFEPLRQRADRVPAWETIGPLLDRSPYLPTVAKRRFGRQTVANVRKLLSLAAGEPGTGARAFAEHVRTIQRLDHREGEALAVDDDTPAVTLSTVHGAKGLEWDTVIVGDTLARLGKPRPDEISRDARRGLVEARLRGKGTAMGDYLRSREKESAVEEDLRLLYVAMTRARERLCVVVGPGPGQDTLAGRVARAVGFPDRLAEGIRVREGSKRPQVDSPG